MNWVFAHMEDPDFNQPLPVSDSNSNEPAYNPESVMLLESFGFSNKAVKKALAATGGDIERASDWLFSRYT